MRRGPRGYLCGRIGEPSIIGEEARVSRRERRRGSQGRAEGRVRGRVRESARSRGRTRDGQSGGGSRQGRFDVEAIEDYASRLTGRGTSGFPAAASGLAGAASGLAGGGLAQRFLGGGSDEDFKREVGEHLARLDERLRRLEDEVYAPAEGEESEGPAEAEPDQNL